MNADSPIVDDKFMPEEEVMRFHSLVAGESFPWFFMPYNVTEGDCDEVANKDSFIDSPQFFHLFYGKGLQTSNHMNEAFGVFNWFSRKHGIGSKAILRAKCNLMLKGTDPRPIMPHTDYTFDHKVFLYYVNVSDGDTVLFNEKYEDKATPTLTENFRVSPSMGRGMVFDGLTYHAPCLPQNNETRIVLNIAYLD